MKVRVPDYYNDFKCLGDTCPDTCCVGWLIEIDDASYERFKSLKGPIGKKVMDNITISDEGKPVFKLQESGRCAFLNENNLCQMYIDLGPDSQCSLCDNYPRIGEEFGSLRELGLSVSCPEVARILLSHDEQIRYQEWELDQDIQGTDYVGDDTFELIMSLREIAVFIAQNRAIDIHDRIRIYIVLAARMQTAMDNNDFNTLACIADDFSDINYINKIPASFKHKTHNLMPSVYEYMTKLDYISKSFVDLLEAAASRTKSGLSRFTDIQLENILVYLILRYFMKIINDGDIYGKAVFAAFFLMTVEDISAKTDAKLTDILYLFSKEIEHCEENMEILNNWFWDEPWNNPANIL